jgi:hypothetical protein
MLNIQAMCDAAMEFLRRSIGTSAGIHKAQLRRQAAALREAPSESPRETESRNELMEACEWIRLNRPDLYSWFDQGGKDAGCNAMNRATWLDLPFNGRSVLRWVEILKTRTP